MGKQRVMTYTCTRCGKEVTTTRSYRDSEGNLVCNKCKHEIDPNFRKIKGHVDYKCTKCGRHVTTQASYHDLDGNLVCRQCQLTERIGAPSTFQTEAAREHTRQTCLERYGVEYTLQSKELHDKIKQTCLTKYGVKSTLQAKEVKDKIDAVNLERYGTTVPMRSEIVKDRVKSTNMERYGVSCSLHSESSIEKKTQTWMNHYGVDNPFKSEEFKKLREDEFRARRNSESRLEYLIRMASAAGYIYKDKYLREDGEYVLVFYCSVCEDYFEWCIKDDWYNVYCKRCGIENYASNKEGQLLAFIRNTLQDSSITHTRKVLSNTKELDIYIPQKSLAIEFDGTYWHDGINNYYKYQECRDKGIRLIQITETEWDTNQYKIQQYLKSTLGIFDKTIYARKCKVQEITNEVYNDFMFENHLQGTAPAKIRLGLFYEDELVQVESFSKPRYTDKCEYELIRECSKSGYKVIGGKSKLFKYFIRNYDPNSILSYCEKNKFNGNSYIKCGFKLLGETAPGYRYHKDGRSYSRLKFQKHKLKDLLENYDENLTEIDNMRLNGYKIIYDYGNYVFIWTK